MYRADDKPQSPNLLQFVGYKIYNNKLLAILVADRGRVELSA